MILGSTKLGMAVLELAADVKGLRDDLAKAQAATKKATGGMDADVKKSTESGAKQFMKLAGAVGLGTAGVDLLRGAVRGATTELGKMVRASIDAEETVSLINVSFGEHADAMRDWSKTSTAAITEQTIEVQKRAAVGYNIARGMGVEEQAALGLSKQVTELTADFASFFNITNEEAFLKIRAGLVGESEPLRQLGIVLTENEVKAYAVAKGWAEAGGQVDAAAKAMARLELITQKAGPAVGDMARTANSTANQIKQLQARIKDYELAVGDAIVQSADWGEALGNLNSIIGNLTDPNKMTALRIMSEDIAEIADGITEIIDGLTMGEGADTEVVARLGKLIDPIQALADLHRVSEGLDQFIVGDLAGARERVSKMWGGKLLGVEDPFADLEKNMEAARAKAEELGIEFGKTLEPAGALADSTGLTAENLESAGDEAKLLKEALEQTVDMHELAANAARKEREEALKTARERIAAFKEEQAARADAYRTSAEKVGLMVIDALKAGDTEFVRFIQRHVDESKNSLQEMVAMGAASVMDLDDRWRYSFERMKGATEEQALLAVMGFEAMAESGEQSAERIEQAFKKTATQIKEVAQAASRTFTATAQLSPEQMEEMAARRMQGGDLAFAVRLLQGAANIREERAQFEQLKQQMQGWMPGMPNPFGPQPDQPGASPGRPLFVRPVGPDSTVEAGAV